MINTSNANLGDTETMTFLSAEAVSQFAKRERGMALAMARYPAGDGCR